MKSKTIPTVCVGIPALNEQSNIRNLLMEIVEQVQVSYRLEKIIVISDGSTDDTAKQAATVGDKRIEILNFKTRKGKTIRQNQILKKSSSDFLIFCDADVFLQSTNLFEEIIFHLKNKTRFGVCGVNTTPTQSKTFFECIINYSVTMQQRIRKKWNNGNNFLGFRGSLLLLEKAYYSKIELPPIVANDAYLYLRALQLGFTPVYLSAVHVYYKSPVRIADHIKQSARFKTSLAELTPYIKENDKAYFTIPKNILHWEMLWHFARNPILMAAYFVIQLYCSKITYNTGGMTWDVAESTKHT
jgi:glycosyltransferase involved in cell wall biosynthesis